MHLVANQTLGIGKGKSQQMSSSTSCKKRPPTQEMLLVIDRRQRGDIALSRRGQMGRRAPAKDASREEVRRYTEMMNDFKRTHGAAGWTAVQSVVTLLKEGTMHDHKMVWFFKTGGGAKYFVDQSSTEHEEF